MKKRKKTNYKKLYKNITQKDIEETIGKWYTTELEPKQRNVKLYCFSIATFKMFDDALKDAFRRHMQNGKSK